MEGEGAGATVVVFFGAVLKIGSGGGFFLLNRACSLAALLSATVICANFLDAMRRKSGKKIPSVYPFVAFSPASDLLKKIFILLIRTGAFVPLSENRGRIDLHLC